MAPSSSVRSINERAKWQAKALFPSCMLGGAAPPRASAHYRSMVFMRLCSAFVMVPKGVVPPRSRHACDGTRDDID